MRPFIAILYFYLLLGVGSVSAQSQLPDCPTTATEKSRSCKFVSKEHPHFFSKNRSYWLAADASGTFRGLITYGSSGPKYLGQVAFPRVTNHYDLITPNGIGGMYYPNGSVVEGRWKDGFFQENFSIPLSFLAQYIETVNDLNASVWMPDALQKTYAGGSQNPVVEQSRASSNNATASTTLSSEYIFCPSDVPPVSVALGFGVRG